MCDHCVKRERAYADQPTEVRESIEALQFEANAKLTVLAMSNGEDSEEFTNAYLEFGDSLDILLGLAQVPAVPDTVPTEWLD